MDSVNSGSLQSSSGGDDEFDSRCGGGGGDSSPLSALLRQTPPAPSSAPGFGGVSFYGLRQELATPPPLSHSHWSSTPLPAGAGGASTAPRSSGHGVPPASSHADQAAAAVAAQQAVPAPPRGSRKRTRASRRAPTTVLTTDTSNFRAMVQEFTGIPAPPFAAGASSARSRFDHLFSSHSAAGLSPYLLRPFAQKLQAAPYPPAFITTTPTTSSSPPAPANIAVATSSALSTTAVGSSDGYQLASAPSSVLGMQDHRGGNYLSFQQSSIGAQLDGNARYTAHPMFDTAGPPPAQRLPDSAGFLGLAHDVMSSEGTHLQPRHRDHGHGGDELSGLVGAASVSSAGGCKVMYSSGAGSAPRPTPNAEGTSTGISAATTMTPVTATAAMRTQGVESWICTSE